MNDETNKKLKRKKEKRKKKKERNHSQWSSSTVSSTTLTHTHTTHCTHPTTRSLLSPGKKFACGACIKGHRSTSCSHTDRTLLEIGKKGAHLCSLLQAR
jgi:hypothetical protein